MKIEKICKDSFVVIGKEGSTLDGDGFIQRLWQDANAHFDEIADLAKRDESGDLVGIWGAMTDFSRSFQPWDDFKRGLYLAGAECRDDAEAPEGWVKWVLPGYEYLVVESEGPHTFSAMWQYMKENSIPLAGAVYDYSCPTTGKDYMYFPVRKR
ncbi:MAG: GyrI-like domain-containing protein [Clostridiales bacterium]|nr:GyrI-like domain-containing protein [Clostridiales bacterium]